LSGLCVFASGGGLVSSVKIFYLVLFAFGISCFLPPFTYWVSFPFFAPHNPASFFYPAVSTTFEPPTPGLPFFCPPSGDFLSCPLTWPLCGCCCRQHPFPPIAFFFWCPPRGSSCIRRVCYHFPLWGFGRGSFSFPLLTVFFLFSRPELLNLPDYKRASPRLVCGPLDYPLLLSGEKFLRPSVDMFVPCSCSCMCDFRPLDLSLLSPNGGDLSPDSFRVFLIGPLPENYSLYYKNSPPGLRVAFFCVHRRQFPFFHGAISAFGPLFRRALYNSSPPRLFSR